MTVAAQEQAGAPKQGPVLKNFSPQLINWLVLGAFAILCLVLRDRYEDLVTYPESLMLPIEAWLDSGMAWFTARFKETFRAISYVLSWPMRGGEAAMFGYQFSIWGLEDILHNLPWPATILMVGIIAYAAKGWKLAAFCVAAMAYMLIIGFWDESMSTLALVGISVPMSLLLGFTLGLLGFQFRWARRIVEPTLDIMQTVPTFAYLVPILILFGIGPVAGMVASAIYASPPVVRAVILGLSRVPDNVIESGQMSGCNRLQLLFMVRIPAATQTIMIGVNQTIMSELSMVIIDAVIGGFADIGREVLSTVRKAQVGQGVLAGLVIVLMAMMMDRISRGFAERSGDIHVYTGGNFLLRHPYLSLLVAAMGAGLILGSLFPEAFEYPEAWIYYPAEDLNNALSWFTRHAFGVTDAIKTYALYYFMLPMKIGLESAARPRSWGFDMSTTAAVIYWGLIAVGGFFAVRAGGWRVGVVVALLAFLGMGFILISGAWPRAMLSFYLAATSVAICFLLGGALGIWAAQNDRVSAVLRPINDTLQTMPLFVFLIPVIMVFLVGDFSALLAIIMYAIVPAVRYTEHGLRQVDPVAVEAARMMGCTESQILWRVKLPLAAPEIMLGLNQVVMFALAMLVIAALVGTRGLGQWIYQSLTNAQFGQGIIAGGSMALIAIITDRILQAWAMKKKRDLGLVI